MEKLKRSDFVTIKLHGVTLVLAKPVKHKKRGGQWPVPRFMGTKMALVGRLKGRETLNSFIKRYQKCECHGIHC